jgi:hypothetical protein
MMEIYDLDDLLEQRGHETPYSMARAWYKYIGCGPWTVFLTECGAVYYEDPEVETFDHKRCIGISIGSIVEGSDAEVGPIDLLFPFDMDDLDKALESIDSEASFYWDRDNSNHYCIVSHGNAVVIETWGDYRWEDDGATPGIDKKAIQDFLDQDDEYRRYDDPFQIGEYTLVLFQNDALY